MKPSDTCLEFIRGTESLELSAYPDPGSPLGKQCTHLHLQMRDYTQIPNWEQMPGHPWTIGYGDTGPDVHPGLVIGVVEAEARFTRRVSGVAAGVEKLLAGHPATQGEFDALTSFDYNTGDLASSTLLRLYLSGDKGRAVKQADGSVIYTGAAGEFGRWIHSGGAVLPGLVTRRAAERRLFLYGSLN